MSSAFVPWDLRAADQRDYFERYGDGLVVQLPADAGSRQHGGQPALPHGGAWIHIGASGLVHAFTGKVEVGQGTRRSLLLIVAAELQAPLSSVRIVMGDTDVSPWDMGTFGSLSMPAEAPRVRAVARRAAQLLRELAASAGRQDSNTLVLRDGQVCVRGSESGLPYGSLVRGLRRIDTLAPGTRAMLATNPSAAPALGALDDPAARAAVTGTTVFTSDLHRPGMLFGKLLHPPAYGATLRSLDTDAARRLPNVVLVREGPLVAVAAPSLAAADAAIDALHAEWALPTPAPEHGIAEYLRAHPSEGEGFWGAMAHDVGDAEQALAGAPVSLSATYRTAYIAHVPLECRAALADWSEGRCTVWVGTQRPFEVRRELAEALGMAEPDVHVVVPPTGSAFGGKHTGDIALAAARLASASGRPVHVAYTREEEFRHGYFRPYAVIDVRSGATAEGTLQAWRFHNINSGVNGALTPYRVPHQRVRHQPAQSPLPQGSYRALAATANHFARESHMDELAARFGVDPLEYRLRHLDDERLAAVFRMAAERGGWWQRPRTPGSGFGIAGGVEKGGRIATLVEARVHAGGQLELVKLVSAFECGAIVDRDNLERQVEGATVMGLGGALFEAIHFEAGRVSNPRLSQYRVPRFTDVPPLELALLDRPDQASAGGGETPIVAIAPAIAGAIFEATGQRLRELPLAPDGRVPQILAGPTYGSLSTV